MDELLRRADKDGDKHLSYREFIGLVSGTETDTCELYREFIELVSGMETDTSVTRSS